MAVPVTQDDISRAIVAQTMGALMADIVALKIENALLRQQLAQMQEKQGEPPAT